MRSIILWQTSQREPQQLQRDEIDPQRAASLQRISDQVYRAHER